MQQIKLFIFFSCFDRGLCSIFRSEAGGQTAAKKERKKRRIKSKLFQNSLVDTCYEEDLDDDDDDADVDADNVDDSESDEDDENYKNNSHLLSDVDGDPLPQRSNFVSYYDATSLYPSSGE